MEVSGGPARPWMRRIWQVLAIVVLGAALALAILNGWYNG
jgi:hypothetical protein